MNNPKLPEYGRATQFTSTRRPKNPGRKPRAFKKWVKDNNVSAEDASIICRNLLSKSLKELKDIVKNPDIPIYMTGAASALLRDWTKGSLSARMALEDRAWGKPKEKIEHSGKMGINNLTKEELDKEFDALMEKYNSERNSEK